MNQENNLLAATPKKLNFKELTDFLMDLADQQGCDITLQYPNGTQMVVKRSANVAAQPDGEKQ